jgi:macrodomain Ter protein organizer (MatP/YcbG family)
MKDLKNIQISEKVWEQLKKYCSEEGYTIKGYVEKLIKQDIQNGEQDKNILPSSGK